jgi:HSP90 family molecular chaperone
MVFVFKKLLWGVVAAKAIPANVSREKLSQKFKMKNNRKLSHIVVKDIFSS